MIYCICLYFLDFFWACMGAVGNQNCTYLNRRGADRGLETCFSNYQVANKAVKGDCLLRPAVCHIKTIPQEIKYSRFFYLLVNVILAFNHKLS